MIGGTLQFRRRERDVELSASPSRWLLELLDSVRGPRERD